MTAASIQLRGPRRRSVWLVLAVVTVIGAVVIGVYPTRTYFSQRSALKSTQHQLDVLNTENTKLEQQAAALNDDAMIENLAREKFGLVRPGEEAFAMLPAPPAKVSVPPVWPFTGLAQKVNPPTK